MARCDHLLRPVVSMTTVQFTLDPARKPDTHKGIRHLFDTCEDVTELNLTFYNVDAGSGGKIARLPAAGALTASPNSSNQKNAAGQEKERQSCSQSSV